MVVVSCHGLRNASWLVNYSFRYAIFFTVAFVIIITAVTAGHLFIPVFTVFVALATGAIMVIVSCYIEVEI